MAKYKSAAEPVFNSLMSAIAAREYAPGDRLPSEKDLEERYGVSRVTIRTALNMLSTLGVIETKTGGGSYVKKFDFSFITGVASKLILAQVPGEDIVQYRSVIETAAVRDLKAKRFCPAISPILKTVAGA